MSEQGNRLEDGMPIRWLEDGKLVENPSILEWVEVGQPCRLCRAMAAQGQTCIRRELLESLGDQSLQEAFIRTERAAVQARLAELGDICAQCLLTQPGDEPGSIHG
jgi:hypothetical protein